MARPAGVVGTAPDDRFARQRLIPRWDQERLVAATAVVVGLGALGNEVAKNLTLVGVGRVVLCDPDVVGPSNLSRTVLFTAADVGRAKVAAAAAALTQLAPDLVVVARQATLVSGVGLGELSDADIVLGCLDSRRARLQLLGRCALVDAPLVDGGTHPWGGEVRLRFSIDEPCFGCMLSPGQRAESDTPIGCDDARDAAAPLPASILSTSLVAGWMTLAAVRRVLGEPLPWRFMEIDGATGATGPVHTRRDPQCPHHHPLGAVEPCSARAGSTVGQLLSALPADVEPLTWALFPLAGTCYHCNGQYSAEYAANGGTAICPHCGRRVRMRFSQQLTRADPDASLAQLGVAPEEIVAVRTPEGGYRWVRLRP